MSDAKKIEKQFKRTGRQIEENIKDPKDSVKRLMEDTGLMPEIPEPEQDVIIPIPDENVAALEARRRRSKASRSGRDSTILTEGLGG